MSGLEDGVASVAWKRHVLWGLVGAQNKFLPQGPPAGESAHGETQYVYDYNLQLLRRSPLCDQTRLTVTCCWGRDVVGTVSDSGSVHGNSDGTAPRLSAA